MIENKKQVSFNDYVETYEKEIQSSIGFIHQDHSFFIELKANIIKEIAEKNFDEPEKINILDIGSGIGLIDHFLNPDFKNINGVDIESGVVEKARLYNPGVNYKIYDSKNLPYDDNTMDMIFTVNVMHHIKPAYWENFIKEMNRVTKPGGIAVIFEHNPLNPLTRLAVSRCEFDRDANLIHRSRLRKLFIKKYSVIGEEFILFFPFKSKMFRSVEKLLKWLPLGAQYYICGKK